MIRSTLTVLATLLAATAAFADGFPGLSLRIRDEAAPAGSIVQIKIDVTEPKPISTGKGKVKVKGLTAVEGISLGNHGQDAYGVVLVDGDELTFFVHSPSSAFGTATDYPIVTVAGVVDPTARTGETFPLEIDPGALQFLGLANAQYPLEIANGRLTVANDAIAIGDVSPGSSIVPAGGVVHISGANFTPTTRIQLSESQVAETRYISGNRIDVVLARTTDMLGLRIRARNDRSESMYYSYQRTSHATTGTDAMLARAVPLFAPNTYTDATVRLPAAALATHRRRSAGPSRGGPAARVAQAFAIQNVNASPASATIELLDAAGHAYAINTIALQPNQTVLQQIDTAFGPVSPPSAFRMRSNAPLHILGVLADASAKTLTALPPD